MVVDPKTLTEEERDKLVKSLVFQYQQNPSELLNILKLHGIGPCEKCGYIRSGCKCPKDETISLRSRDADLSKT